MKSVGQRSWIGGILAALAASLCCIAPLLAIFGGIGGAATYFNWIGPFRPYIISITILIFAFAWYQKLIIEPRQKQECCEPAKPSFWRSQKTLLFITLFSGLLIAFPYYSSLFYKSPQQSQANTISRASFKYVTLHIRGMGCADCTKHIDGTLAGLKGVSAANTSFEKAQTVVCYDPAKTNADSITRKITAIGYQPTLIKTN